jgi:hypothetical protein
MEDDLTKNGRRPKKWKTTFKKNGRRPNKKWKKTQKMEDNLKKIIKWETTKKNRRRSKKMEDDLKNSNGRRPKKN